MQFRGGILKLSRILLNILKRSLVGFLSFGYNEPATTNAPVGDEAI